MITIDQIKGIKPNTITNIHKCRSCEWPVLDVCCNDGFADNLPDGECADWWAYCTNKNCDHHEGNSIGQSGDRSWFVGVK